MAGIRVLFAEDEVATRMLVAATMRAWGYEVVAVASGEEAVASVRERPAEILVTDWELPDLDGPTLIERARRESGGRDLFVLMLTHHVDSLAIARGLSAGADDFASKPFEPMALRTRLEVAKRTLLVRDRLRAAQEALAGVDPHDVLERAHERARRRRRSYGLVRFAGPVDAHVLGLLRSLSREDDLVLRVGADVLLVSDGVAEGEWAGVADELVRRAREVAPGPSAWAFHDAGVDEPLAEVLSRVR